MPEDKLLYKRLCEINRHNLSEAWISICGKFTFTSKPAGVDVFYIKKDELIYHLKNKNVNSTKA